MAPTSGSAAITKKNLRSSQEIFLVGNYESDILGSKLPSKKQVLQLFFYKRRVEEMSVRNSLIYAVDVAMKFWEKARIPHMSQKCCIEKLQKLIDRWKILQKHKNTGFEKHRRDEKEFQDNITHYIFDLAAPDALRKIKIQEDKDFLLLQRQKGRPGSMASVDATLTQKEQRRDKRSEKEENRLKKYRENIIATSVSEINVSNDVNDYVVDDGNVSMDEIVSPNKIPKERTREKINFVDDRMLASMDKCKISSRNAMHLVSATASALLRTLKEVDPCSKSIELEDLVFSRTKIQSMRKDYRRRQARQILEAFNVSINRK